MKIFLIDHDIPVRAVVAKANEDKDIAFVYLTDGGNIFSPALVENLNKSLATLDSKIRSKFPSEEHTELVKKALNNLYPR